jgi:hypothetical protein
VDVHRRIRGVGPRAALVCAVGDGVDNVGIAGERARIAGIGAVGRVSELFRAYPEVIVREGRSAPALIRDGRHAAKSKSVSFLVPSRLCHDKSTYPGGDRTAAASG